MMKNIIVYICRIISTGINTVFKSLPSSELSASKSFACPFLHQRYTATHGKRTSRCGAAANSWHCKGNILLIAMTKQKCILTMREETSWLPKHLDIDQTQCFTQLQISFGWKWLYFQANLRRQSSTSSGTSALAWLVHEEFELRYCGLKLENWLSVWDCKTKLLWHSNAP